MSIWIAAAGGSILFLLGSAAGGFFPIINLLWLVYALGIMGLVFWWSKHLLARTENLLREFPDQSLAEKAFPVKLAEFGRVDRNMLRLYKRIQLYEFTLMNQKARQAGENFNLMLSSSTDPLTGVPNRGELDKYLEKVTGRMNPLSVIMVDIDHFKEVNDTYGHDAGDAVLQQFSSIVKNSVRPGDFLGRYGGEEFMVICNADLEEAAEIAERIRLSVSSIPVKVSNCRSVSITASLGVAGQVPGQSIASLVKRADKALYEAKQGGRNRVEKDGEMLCAG